MEFDEISRYLSPITVGFLSAYLGSKLSLNKFKQEKIWNERRDVYKEIIEAFEEIGFWSKYIKASHFCEPVIDAELKFHEALRTISKHSATGGLFLSKDFQTKLENANINLHQIRFQINEESKPDMYFEQGRAEWLLELSEEIGAVVDNYLPELISMAKTELPK